ncbi:MAG TPA: hypothetical protein DET40_24535 [Lentisphaeria bacterium]|nr:MAG: hypothetical protein A2X45_22960 [Lentisphaerae bacterium GWF2_50_93]HCE46727.1 hypothetical protein [Lentisphaeria bacterium]
MSTAIKLLKQPKLQMIALLFLLAGIAVTGGVYGRGALSVHLLAAVATALAAECIFFGSASAASFQSATITGLIAGMLLAPGSSLVVVWAAAVAAIAIKRLFVFNSEGRHIFNPAASGLVLSTVLFSNQINWWGNSSSLAVILGAGIILFRMNRLSLPFAYFLGRILACAATGAAIDESLLLLPNLFFAFIMVVEPKTSPQNRTQQWMFGALCGILSTGIYNIFPGKESDLIALLIVNFLRPLFALKFFNKPFTRSLSS